MALTNRKAQNKDLWKVLFPPLIHYFNKQDVTLKELAYLAYNLNIVKLKSPQIYQIMMDYFVKMNFDENDLIKIGNRVAVNFL